MSIPLVVGIGEIGCSDDTSRTLVTYGLGSCIGVAAYDSLNRVGALLHFMLPDSKANLEKAAHKPAMFADTGIDLLMKHVLRLGGDPKRLKVRLAGGAQILEGGSDMRIGQRNYMAARKKIWQLGLLLEMEAVGGPASRNLGLNIATGEIWVQTYEQNLTDRGVCR